MSAIKNYSIMGVPLHDLPKDFSTLPSKKTPSVSGFRQSLLAHQTVHWRLENGIETTYKAAKRWFERPDVALMASVEEDSFEAIHKFWQRAEKGAALREKNSSELLRFLGLSDDYNPRRDQGSTEQVRHHGDVLHGRFALQGETQSVHSYPENAPALPTLLLDTLALKHEMMTSLRNPSKRVAEASARSLAIELILLRMVQGLMMSKWAFEERLGHQVLQAAEHTEWPWQVARQLNTQEENSIEPWAGFLELTACLTLRVRHSVRADLLPQLSGFRQASSRMDLWLIKALSPAGELPADLAQLSKQDERGMQIVQQAERVREPLNIACQRLGLAKLPEFIYAQLSQERNRNFRNLKN